jgi:hypothetical protein
MLSATIREQLLRFCNEELDPQSFEAWVCTASGVESEVGHGTYVDLISADYCGRDAGGVREVCASLLEHHHPGALRRYRVARILESMVQGDDAALLAGLRRLVRLHQQGYDFIPTTFVGLDSETDSIPSPQTHHLWEPSALAERLGRAIPYQRQIRQAAQELLDELQRGHPDDV